MALFVDAMRAFAEAANDPDRLLALIARETAHVLGAYCSFGIPSEDGQWVRFVGEHDPDPEMQARLSAVFTSPMRRSEHPFASRFDDRLTHVLTSPVPLSILRARAPAIRDEELVALDIRAILFVAMRARSETVGWLALCRHGANATTFTEEDLALARTLADSASANLLNARLLAQRERDVARRAAISEAGRTFAAATGDEAELVQVVARTIGDLFDGLCVVRRVVADGTLETVGVHHPDPRINEQVKWYAAMPITPGQTITGAVAASGVARIIDEMEPEFHVIRTGPFSQFVEAARISASMFAPLMTRDRTVGVVAIGLSDGRRFSGDDLTLLQDLAAHASVALMNSELLAESRRTEEVLRRGFLDAAPDAVLIVGLDGKIVVANRQAETLFGYTRAELLELEIEELVPERLRAAHAERRGAFGRAPVTRPMGAGLDLFARRKDGSEFAAEIMLSPIDTAGGVLVAAAIRDVTERRREMDERNRRMADANRLKSEFLANMSHELRTPLNAIIGFASLMHAGKAGPMTETHVEYLGDILTSARHLLQLINDILDLAKIESGRMELHYQTVDLDALVREIRDILRGLTVSKRVQLGVAIEPELGRVEVDPRMLKQVLYNYLSNAIKFSADESAIHVRIQREGERHFRIDVEDEGIGIAEQDLPRLFIEFQQLEQASTKRHQGTGLGLALVKRIVEAHRGSVDVRSVLGKGSTFSAVLPRQRPPAGEN